MVAQGKSRFRTHKGRNEERRSESSDESEGVKTRKKMRGRWERENTEMRWEGLRIKEMRDERVQNADRGKVEERRGWAAGEIRERNTGKEKGSKGL